MSRSLRRGAAATVAIALLPLAAACSAGTSAETTKIRPDSAYTSLNQVEIQNLHLVPGAPGTGLIALGGAFINNGKTPAVITKVTIQGLPTPATLKDAHGAIGPLTVPGVLSNPATFNPVNTGNAIYITGAAGEPTITFTNANLMPGTYQTVVFDFATQGEVSVPVTVQAPDNPLYASLRPTAPETHPTAPTTPAAPSMPVETPPATTSPTAPVSPTSTASSTGSPASSGSPKP